MKGEDYEDKMFDVSWMAEKPTSPQKRRRKSTAPAPVAGLDVSCDVRFRGKKKSEVDRFGIRDAERRNCDCCNFLSFEKGPTFLKGNTILGESISPRILQQKHDTMII